jgi:aldehyde:ferredoxin oxidoreductase
MGSKGLLAIVVDVSAAPKEKMADSAVFRDALKEVARLVNTTPQTAEIFRKYGTNAMMMTTNAIGGLPVRNFSRGVFERAEAIDGNALYKIITERGGEGNPSHSCMPGCLIRCSNVFPDKDGKALVSPLEYENAGLLGSNCGIGDLDSIAGLNYACNDMGLDTIDTGAAIGVAMEAGLAPFGDAEFALRAITGVAKGEMLSKVIGSGAEITGRVLGQWRTPTAKGQALAAYDPRAIKGTGVTYATSAMGGDHTAGNTARLQVKQHEKEGQVAHSKNAQAGAMLFDALGLCVMLAAAVRDPALVVALVNARFGTRFTVEEARALAAETFRHEREFNRRAGIGPEADRIAEFFYEEQNPDSGAVFDFTPEDFAELQ